MSTLLPVFPTWHVAADAPTSPTDAPSGGILHVRFAGSAGHDRVIGAMEAFRSLLHDRPGATKVVIHLPSGGGDGLPLELRTGVAYDAELLAEVRRRLGEGVVALQLLPVPDSAAPVPVSGAS